MKIYNRVEIDISTGEILYEDSFEWAGPVVECKGGGGSASGSVDFPDHMKDIHDEWLSNQGADSIAAGESVTALITSGINNSPFAGEVAYNPAVDITEFLNALVTYEELVEDIGPATTWVDFIDQAKETVEDSLIDDTVIDNYTQAHADVMNDRLESEVLPKYKTGMRDIEAVMTSSFTVGEAILRSFHERDVAEFDARIRLLSYDTRNKYIMEGSKELISLMQLKLGHTQNWAQAVVEARRIKAVLGKEQIAEQIAIDEDDYRWGLELYQYGGNIMSSISGSAVQTSKGGSSKTASAVGGALSGAAAGAMVGSAVPGIGTAIGAAGGLVVGGIGGYLMG